MVSAFILYGIPAVVVLYGIRKYRESKWGKCSNKVRLDGKVVVITGANSGVGFEAAKELAARGAQIIFACRNEKLALEAIKKLGNKGNLKYIELDLASIDSIKCFAEKIKTNYNKIDILINNAGVSYPNPQKMLTKDNFEIQFGVNYLSHFLLTNLLLEQLKNANARVINVSSLLHQKGTLDLDDLNYEKRPLKNGYADSKLAMMYFGRELANRVSDIKVYSLCPGWVFTNLFRHSIKKAIVLGVFILPIAFLFMRNKKQGVQTIIYCATDPGLEKESGYFYRDCTKLTSTHKFDDANGKRLWDVSVKMLEEKGCTF